MCAFFSWIGFFLYYPWKLAVQFYTLYNRIFKKSWFSKLKKLGDIFFSKIDKIKIHRGYVFIVLFILYVLLIIVPVTIIRKGINKCWKERESGQKEACFYFRSIFLLSSSLFYFINIKHFCSNLKLWNFNPNSVCFPLRM